MLSIKRISKAYGSHQALNNVSIEVPEGSIFGLLGPNGAGKTTLIRIINQIIEADEGEITLNGKKLTQSHIQTIGYLPEERGLYKKMKVGDQLVYLGRLRGLSRKDAVECGKKWCEKLDIFEWWGKKIEDLSKGMAQKIQFISTILHDPKLIILDEPFSGFDPVNAELIKDEILEIRERGATIIFSTHRMESVEQLCDHIALINKSEKILEGPKQQIKEENRDGSYMLEYIGTLQANDEFQILNTTVITRKLNRSILQFSVDGNPNDLIRSLVNQVEIHAFMEQIPSMNDIFISKVKRGES